MTETSTLIALVAILGLSAIAAVFYGTRYRKRRRAEKLRLRGYKAYNRGRPELVIDESAQSSMADNIARP